MLDDLEGSPAHEEAKSFEPELDLDDDDEDEDVLSDHTESAKVGKNDEIEL